MLLPTGETMPRPVMTTLRRAKVCSGNWGIWGDLPQTPGRRVKHWPARAGSSEGLLLVGEDVVDRLLNGGDLLGLIIRNLGLEFLFERHHQFNGIQRIRAQIINERRLVLDVGLVDAELFGDDL